MTTEAVKIKGLCLFSSFLSRFIYFGQTKIFLRPLDGPVSPPEPRGDCAFLFVRTFRETFTAAFRKSLLPGDLSHICQLNCVKRFSQSSLTVPDMYLVEFAWCQARTASLHSVRALSHSLTLGEGDVFGALLCNLHQWDSVRGRLTSYQVNSESHFTLSLPQLIRQST